MIIIIIMEIMIIIISIMIMIMIMRMKLRRLKTEVLVSISEVGARHTGSRKSVYLMLKILHGNNGVHKLNMIIQMLMIIM